MFATLGGDRGNLLDIQCVPDATFKTEIDALVLAGTKVVDKLVQFTWSNNYEVTSPAANAIPDGEIITFEKDDTYGYILGVRVFHYPTQNGTSKTPTMIKQLPYEGSLALQDSSVIYNSDYDSVDDGTTADNNAAIAIDSTNGIADFLC